MKVSGANTGKKTSRINECKRIDFFFTAEEMEFRQLL
jgi:hypothetical protein